MTGQDQEYQQCFRHLLHQWLEAFQPRRWRSDGVYTCRESSKEMNLLSSDIDGTGGLRQGTTQTDWDKGQFVCSQRPIEGGITERESRFMLSVPLEREGHGSFEHHSGQHKSITGMWWWMSIDIENTTLSSWLQCLNFLLYNQDFVKVSGVKSGGCSLGFPHTFLEALLCFWICGNILVLVLFKAQRNRRDNARGSRPGASSRANS